MDAMCSPIDPALVTRQDIYDSIALLAALSQQSDQEPSQPHPAQEDSCHGGNGNESTTSVAGEKSKKKRRVLDAEQLRVLETAFEAEPTPNNNARGKLGESLGIPERNVQIWFQNRRAKHKRTLRASQKFNTEEESMVTDKPMIEVKETCTLQEAKSDAVTSKPVRRRGSVSSTAAKTSTTRHVPYPAAPKQQSVPSPPYPSPTLVAGEPLSGDRTPTNPCLEELHGTEDLLYSKPGPYELYTTIDPMVQLSDYSMPGYNTPDMSIAELWGSCSCGYVPHNLPEHRDARLASLPSPLDPTHQHAVLDGEFELSSMQDLTVLDQPAKTCTLRDDQPHFTCLQDQPLPTQYFLGSAPSASVAQTALGISSSDAVTNPLLAAMYPALNHFMPFNYQPQAPPQLIRSQSFDELEVLSAANQMPYPTFEPTRRRHSIAAPPAFSVAYPNASLFYARGGGGRLDVGLDAITEEGCQFEPSYYAFA
ncbi:hypothetical protein HKX48_004629 [Thoreauomyces humboldtii]|nr:hypothetical protein HKX48_004629 [Thoreauomyces humboldtii]